MKKGLYLFYLLLISSTISAQYCGNSGPMACTATAASTAIISSYNDFDCVKRGEAFDETIQMHVPTTYSIGGFPFEVQKLRIDSITNLPCGLCWRSDHPSNLFLANSYHCIRISGISNDPVGVYRTDIHVFVTLTSGMSVSGLLDLAGAQFYIRVIDTLDVCPPVIIQPGDTTETLTQCGQAPVPCTQQLWVDVVEGANGPTCNLPATSYTVAPYFSDVRWILYDTTQSFYDTIFSHTFDPATEPTKKFMNVMARDTGGCLVIGQNLQLTKSGVYTKPEICVVVLDSAIGHNVLVWSRGKNANDSALAYYNIYSNVNDTARHPATLVGTVPFRDETFLIDTVNAPGNDIIKYEIRLVDTCGFEIVADEVFAPIHLHVDTVSNVGIATLRWNYINHFPLSLYSSGRLWKSFDNVNWEHIQVGIGNYDGQTVYNLASFIYNDTLSTSADSTVYMMEMITPRICEPSEARSMSYSRMFSNRVIQPAFIPVGINDRNAERMVLYPNPANNLLMIKNAGEQVKEVQLYDITGRQVFASTTINGGTVKCDVSLLDKGIYVARVITATGSYSKNWVKQ